MGIKYILQVSKKESIAKVLEACQQLDYEKFLIVGGDIKIYPYDPDTDQIIATAMNIEDTVKFLKLETEQNMKKVNSEGVKK